MLAVYQFLYTVGMMMYRNVHGRTPGRGLRPWLLIPKVLGVAVYFGGLVAAAAVIGAFYADGGAAASRQQWIDLTYTLRAIFVFAAVPGLLLAIVCGVGLLWHSRWVLWRMRWMKLKAAILIVTIPLLHLFMSSRLVHVREHGEGGAAMVQFNIALAAAIAFAVMVIFLGRHKPRLGQGVRAFAEQRGTGPSGKRSDASQQEERA